jgi:hypothetical protein
MSVVPPDTLEIVVKPVAGTKPIIVTGQMIKTAILRAFEKAQ